MWTSTYWKYDDHLKAIVGTQKNKASTRWTDGVQQPDCWLCMKSGSSPLSTFNIWSAKLFKKLMTAYKILSVIMSSQGPNSRNLDTDWCRINCDTPQMRNMSRICDKNKDAIRAIRNCYLGSDWTEVSHGLLSHVLHFLGIKVEVNMLNPVPLMFVS